MAYGTRPEGRQCWPPGVRRQCCNPNRADDGPMPARGRLSRAWACGIARKALWDAFTRGRYNGRDRHIDT